VLYNSKLQKRIGGGGPVPPWHAMRENGAVGRESPRASGTINTATCGTDGSAKWLEPLD
jgi:hypothetical protein